jgi:putative endonuclease
VVPVRANNAIGAYGERVGVQHLEKAGYTIVDRNWRCDLGEIDVVALTPEDPAGRRRIVVCEVKTRSGLGFGSGFDAVTRAKAARLRRLGHRWLAEHEAPAGAAMRFDILAVHIMRRGEPRVEHLQGAL